jgi:hypothetical protein
MNLKMLDLVIGVVFFFTFASLICTTVRELIESALATRAKMLEKALREILNDETPGQTDGEKSILVRFYEHPLIDSLFRGNYASAVFGGSLVGDKAKGLWRAVAKNRNLPSYIPASHFASALIDVVGQSVPKDPKILPEDKKGQFLALHKALNQSDLAVKADPKTKQLIPNARLRSAVLWALENADEDIEKAKKNLEDWYNNSMDRVTGWYKRNTQAWLLFIGACVALLLNMNSIEVVRRLYEDDAMRAAVVGAVDKYVNDPNSAKEDRRVDRQPADAPPTPSGTQPIKVETGKAAKPTAPVPAALVTTQPTVPAEAKPAEALGLQQIQFLTVDLERYKSVLDAVDYPIGWTAASRQKFTVALQNPENEANRTLLETSVSGWLLTAVAMTLGASFWFDLLNKLVSMRSSLKPETPPVPESEN